MRILLADDHPAIRAGIRGALEEAGFQVVGEASSGEEALRLVEELRPDVLVLDVVMPGVNGVEVARALREKFPHLHILALSAYWDDEYVFGLLQAGAKGYVLKEEAVERIVDAVRVVAGGGTWLSEKVQARVMERAAREEAEPVLTERELEVLRLMAEGKGNREIAEALCVAERTVKYHVNSIYSKLGVTSRVEAVIYAIRKGWVRV